MKSRNWKSNDNRNKKGFFIQIAKKPFSQNEDDYGKNSEWSNSNAKEFINYIKNLG